MLQTCYTCLQVILFRKVKPWLGCSLHCALYPIFTSSFPSFMLSACTLPSGTVTLSGSRSQPLIHEPTSYQYRKHWTQNSFFTQLNFTWGVWLLIDWRLMNYPPRDSESSRTWNIKITEFQNRRDKHLRYARVTGVFVLQRPNLKSAVMGRTSWWSGTCSWTAQVTPNRPAIPEVRHPQIRHKKQ